MQASQASYMDPAEGTASDKAWKTWHSELDLGDRRSLIHSVRRFCVAHAPAVPHPGPHPPHQILVMFQTKRPQVSKDWGARRSGSWGAAARSRNALR